MTELTTKQKGDLTELQCITAFYELGYTVSIPYGENSRYDFIADVNGKLIRVQVKSALQKDDGSAFEFSCRSVLTNSNKVTLKTYTVEEIDYFCTYFKNKCYLVPVTECVRSKTLRLKPPRIKQLDRIHMAEDYELHKQIDKIKIC